MIKKCKYCKKTFSTNHPRKKYCSNKCISEYWLKKYNNKSRSTRKKKKILKAKNGIEVVNNILGFIYAHGEKYDN